MLDSGRAEDVWFRAEQPESQLELGGTDRLVAEAQPRPRAGGLQGERVWPHGEGPGEAEGGALLAAMRTVEAGFARVGYRSQSC